MRHETSFAADHIPTSPEARLDRRALLRRAALLAVGAAAGGVATLIESASSRSSWNDASATDPLADARLEADLQPAPSSNTTTAPANSSPAPATPDPEVSAAARDLIIQQDRKAKVDADAAWAEVVGGPLTALVAAGSLLLAAGRFLHGQRRQQALQIQQRAIERHREDVARLQNITERMGHSDLWTRTGAAIELLPYTQPQYKEFHPGIFQTVVTYLKLREVDPGNLKPDSFYEAIATSFVSLLPSLRASAIEDTCKRLGKKPSDLTLAEMYEPRIDASGVRMDGFSFLNINFAGLILQGSTWTGASIKDSDLTYVDLQYSTLTGVHIEDTTAKGINLLGSNLEDATIINTRPLNAMLDKVNFDGATLQDVAFMGARLYYTSWVGATCERVIFPQDFSPETEDNIKPPRERGQPIPGSYVLDTMNVEDMVIIDPLDLEEDTRQELIKRGAKFKDAVRGSN